jgi:spermidine/putrescine transport system substrate-binding protein
MRILLVTLLFVLGCKTDTKKELRVYNWANYIGKNTIKDFEAEFGYKVVYDNFSSNEELLAKLQAGASGYDVIVPSDYMVSIMRKAGLLSKLDKSKLPNFKNVDEKYLGKEFDPQNEYCVPYHWGTVGLGINTEFVKEPVDSWSILWNEKYKGKISILDDPRSGFIPALRLMGHSINSTDKGEIDLAKRDMQRQKPLVFAYTSDQYIDMLAAGDVWIAQGYSGDILQAKKENPSIEFILPREGSEIAIDLMCIPEKAPNKDGAHEFIDYILRAEVAASIANEIRYPTTNKAAREFLDEDLVNDPNAYPSDLSNLSALTDVGDAQGLYDAAWLEVKGG